MASGPSWIIDSRRIATKIKSASDNPRKVAWKSNPTRTCPNCKNIIDNSEAVNEWPGLPRGVKFDPSDQELLWHLDAKYGKNGGKAHPFIDEFIPTLEEEEGICYTHPQKLPGVKQDGSVSHFFHRTFKAYNIGTRKRRKIQGNDLGDVRWHKTGKTKPVMAEGVHLGCKKIMVLYVSQVKGEKSEKTGWVMHQYHLGPDEEERDGEFVVSKLFYQVKESEPLPCPNSATPDPPAEKRVREGKNFKEDEDPDDGSRIEEQSESGKANEEEEGKWWDGDSQFMLDSQQLAEGIAMCEEFLQSQNSCENGEGKVEKPCLADYAKIGKEDLKKDLEECQKIDGLELVNVELDVPDMRLSQLEFGSQDSFLAWGGMKGC